MEMENYLLISTEDGQKSVFLDPKATNVPEHIVIPDGVEVIDDEAFEGSEIKSVVIPDSVNFIGNAAFRGCKELESVVFPKGELYIADVAFEGCTALKEVVIPEGCRSLGVCAFGDCTALTTVKLPKTIKEFGNLPCTSAPYSDTFAFCGCTALTTIEMPLPKMEEEDLFYGFKKLKKVKFIGGADELLCDIFIENTELEELHLPNTIKKNSSLDLHNCKKLKTVILPEGMTSARDEDFDDSESFSLILIPDSVTRIDDETFYCCEGLKTIEIPDSVASIEDGAFSGCSNLQSIAVSSGNQHFKSVDGVLYSKNMDSLIMCPEGVDEDAFQIPEGVKHIEVGAFSGCHKLTSIEIPDSVASIGYGAFGYCSNLQSIVVSSGNQHFKSVDGVLYSKNMDSLIRYPEGVEEDAFQIPEGVKHIGARAFSDCWGLTSIMIPNSVISIGTRAFYSCIRLSELHLHYEHPEEITIDKDAFRYLGKCTLLVPAGTVDSYRQDERFKVFKEIKAEQ